MIKLKEGGDPERLDITFINNNLFLIHSTTRIIIIINNIIIYIKN